MYQSMEINDASFPKDRLARSHLIYFVQGDPSSLDRGGIARLPALGCGEDKWRAC
jgi:hypothetical protein